MMNRTLENPEGTLLESTTRRIKSTGDRLVEALLMVDEAKLLEPIKGTSGFTEQFATTGPHDQTVDRCVIWISARDSFKYPCSYLIYSEAFDGLPVESRDYVWQRLFDILTGVDQSEKFAHLSPDDRQAILEILRVRRLICRIISLRLLTQQLRRYFGRRLGAASNANAGPPRQVSHGGLAQLSSRSSHPAVGFLTRISPHQSIVLVKKLWIGFTLVLFVSFLILGWIGTRIYEDLPPIPDKVVTTSGQVLIDSGEIQAGQNVWQSLGGMEVGSIWGHGSYVAPDWTADWLHRESIFILNRWATADFSVEFDALNDEQKGQLTGRLTS